MSARSKNVIARNVIPAKAGTHDNRSNLLFYLCFLLLFFVSCTTPSTPSDTLSIAIPSQWSQDLNAQATPWLAAQLRVYELPAQTKVHDTTMEVDEVNGTVKAKSFKLPGGKTYKFIIEFQYLTSGNAIAFAYAEVEQAIGDGNAETVSFISSDIRYEVDKQDPNISASISQGILPDLDPDNDGWSTYQELKDKVSPISKDSQPIKPTLNISTQQEGTDLLITLEGEDNAHVESLKVTDPICGIKQESETQGANNNKVTKKIVYRLDLLSVSAKLKNLRNIKAIVSDGVNSDQGMNQDEGFKIEAISSNQSRPSFAFSDPELNSELEGFQTLKGIACARDEVKGVSLQHNGDALTGHTTEQNENLLGEMEVTFSQVDTEKLPDGVVNLEVEVTDDKDRTGIGKGQYQVTNSSPIKVAYPKGRKWVFGKEVIEFNIVNQPQVSLISVKGPIGALAPVSSNPASAIYTLDVSNANEGDSITVNVTTKLLDGTKGPARPITFKVRNQPKLKVYKAGELWKGWKGKISYEIENVSAETIKINQKVLQPLKGEAGNPPICVEDSFMEGIITCKGELPIIADEPQTYLLEASRAKTFNDDCGGDRCKSSEDITPPIQTLNSNPPKYGVISNFPGETRPKHELALPENNKEYRIRAIELDNNGQETATIPIDEKKTGGETLDLDDLDPRKDYKFKVEETSGSQILNTLEKIVTTGDAGLVLWLRFNEDPKGPPCAEQDDPSKTICDYSGNNNHGIPQGAPEWLEPPQSGILDGALKFDGVDDYVEIPNSASLNPPSVSIQAKIEILGIVNGGHQEIIDKRMSVINGELSAGFGYELRAMGDVPPLDAVVIIASDDPQSSMGMVKNSILALNTSYVLTATYDDVAKKICLYRNEKLMDVCDDAPGTNPRTIPSSSSAFVSKRSFGHPAPPWFNGNIDEISLYNRPLFAEEVNEHYLSSSGD
ncbi:MAG: hypothetical protein HYU97_10595 [Deltaproteobacteria bacterium]|nr:hypothetical protein [Deltaproteobacteria bacterium]